MTRFIILLPLLATAALSAHADTYVDTARVRSVQPQYETVAVPRQECSSQWINETHRVEGQRGYGEAATALGAVVGAFTGDRLANRGGDRYEQVPRQVQTCQTVNEMQQRLTGYQVAYEYRGQQFVALMPQDPGRQLQVRVSVDPLPR
jgi:uncharacterized protein YcfJ